jgi:hypothetical protein
MNSRRRPRRRPRVTSITLLAFFYVLIREAFLVQLNVPHASRPHSSMRYELARVDDAAVRQRWETHCLRQGVHGQEILCPVHGVCHGCGATRAFKARRP